MRYIVDHDIHIHSQISLCSGDPEQNPQRILQYAKDNGLHTLCLTDHFWENTIDGASEFYAAQDFEHISAAKPLPQTEGIRFLFGCETEMDRFHRLGITRERIDELDFVIIPTTHFHMVGYTLFKKELRSGKTRAKAWVDRLEALLNMDLPFHKIGIAHLACGLIAPTRRVFLNTIKAIPEEDMRRLFTKAAKLGAGIELNSDDMSFKDKEAETVLRPFRIAKECGCKFYLGSDAHHPKSLDAAKAIFERALELLDLQESDKFILR